MVLATPYRIRCADCKHPAKFHDANGCHVKKCDCPHLEAEEMEHELCIDAATMKQICVQCKGEKPTNGLCSDCREREEKLKAEAKKENAS